jgi:G3E family GTPase
MNDAARRVPPEPIPLTVITGFLGAGKTTLLNRLLKDPALKETAVVINEFGEVGLDHLLVEYVSDSVMLLQSGCLCCTMRGDLVDALETLLRDLDNNRCTFRRLVLETTGLADPAPVLHTTMMHPYLVMRYRLDGVVTLVDAVNGEATLDAHAEAVKQAAMADRLVLSKSDLVADPARIEALKARLHALNPAAPILDVAKGEATPQALLDCGLYDPERKIPDVRRWLKEEAYAEPHNHGHDHHHGHAHDHGHLDRNRHDDHIRSFTLTADKPIPAGTFHMFIDLLRSLHGPNLLRLKGIVQLAEAPEKPIVIHAVQHVFHPFNQLARWPDDDRRTRLVFITRDLPEQTIREMFAAFMNEAAPDRPDRAALADNPLVPFGGADR